MPSCNRCSAPLLLRRFFPSFLDAFESLPAPPSLVSPAARPDSSVTERVTNPGWHRVPRQCHHPRSVPAIHPRAASPGDSRGTAAGCSHLRLCLELPRFYLVATPLCFSPSLLGKETLFPGAEETALYREGAGAGGQVLSSSALKHLQEFALCMEKPRLGFMLYRGMQKSLHFWGLQAPQPGSPQPGRHLGRCAGLRRCT